RMTMLGFYAFGPFVERVLGVIRYVVTYFIAGIGPGLVGMLLANTHRDIASEILVGAAGAIMSRVGAEGARMTSARPANKSTLVRRRLLVILMIVVLESVFDVVALSPISLLAHLCGVFFGFATASLLKHRASRATLATSG